MMPENLAKKTHHPHTGVRWPFSHECFSPAAQGMQLWKNDNRQERSEAI